MNYLFKRDSIFATIAVFLVLGMLSLIPVNMHVLSPSHVAAYDFDYNDLAFSQFNKNRNAGVDERIVIVNIEKATRADLAFMLQKLKLAKPKVIGMDVLFTELMEPGGDSLLTASIASVPNLVLCKRLDVQGEKLVATGVFAKYAAHNGHANFVGEEGGVIRYFSPFEEEAGRRDTSFSAAVAELYRPATVEQLEKRGKELEQINYRRTAGQYLVVNKDDLLNDKLKAGALKDKIVLVGIINKSEYDIEDRHFTPMNKNFIGKSLPDMNGVVINANIISMILDQDYIHVAPSWFNWLLAFLLGWFHIAIFIHYYVDRHNWFHLAAKIAQLISAILFIYIGLLLFIKFNWKVNFTPTLLIIILSVDVLYFYEGFSKWMHRKLKHKSVFDKEHH